MRKTMNEKMIFVYSYCLFFIACTSQPAKLETALILAGENRIELEKVINYYQRDPADSLKLKAAIFLIENMPGHYSFEDPTLLTNYYDKIDSVSEMYAKENYEIRDSIFTSLIQAQPGTSFRITPDIKILSGDFLIENIEHSFHVWNEPWAVHIDFNQFCEYILPYKVMEGQIPENWKEYNYQLFPETLTNLKYCSLYRNSAGYACEILNEKLREKMYPHIHLESSYDIRRISTLYNITHGTCETYARLALSLMRAKGIPTAIDFTPQWSFRSMGHSWNIVIENRGVHTIFEGANSAPGLPHKKDHKMAKVFRHMYAINPEIQEIHTKEKYIPSTFRNPCIKDVTEEYMQTYDIEIESPVGFESTYGYLALFDNREWIPVHWGKQKGGKFSFKNMGTDAVYLPVICEAAGTKAFSDPLLIDTKGNITKLTPDTLRKRTLKLNRKYPLLPYAYHTNVRILGARIEASDRPDFKGADTLHIFTDLRNELILPDTIRSYQYWRYCSSHYGYCNVAELAFFDNTSGEPLSGKIIGTEGSFRTDGFHEKEAAFDGDLLTFFDAPEPSDSWVGMDFGKKTKINRITCIMRGDGNNIETGNEYELFYWLNTSWQTLGRKKADDAFIIYNNCPENALFLLRNHTKGKEERIFTYEEDEQIWW